jgi:Tetracyclin repressor-like, C-terminal domain
MSMATRTGTQSPALHVADSHDLIRVQGARENNLKALSAELHEAATLLHAAVMRGIRFEAIWTRVIASFEAHRPALVASFEAFAQAQHSPELREQLAEGHEQARLWLAALFRRIGSTAGEGSAQAVGSFYLAILNGLMVQWLLDPDRAPSGRDVAEALRTILESARHAKQQALSPPA